MTAFTFVQAGDTGGSVNSGFPSTVLPANSTPGNSVALLIAPASSSLADVQSVTSPIGTFVRVSDSEGSSTTEQEWWFCSKVTGSSGQITVTTVDGNAWVAQATEWAGGAIHASSGGGAATGTGTVASKTVSAAPGNVVLVALNAGFSASSSPSSPWTVYNAGAFLESSGRDVAWQVATGANPSAAWNLGSSTSWAISALVLGLPSTGMFAFFR